MKKESTKRKAGRKGQHVSLLQETTYTFEPGDEAALEHFILGEEGWISKVTNALDIDLLIEKEKNFAKNFLSKHGIPTDNAKRYEAEDGSRSLQGLVADKFDHIPGAKPAVAMLDELAGYHREMTKGDNHRAAIHLIYSGALSREIVKAIMEPKLFAGASRTGPASKARKQQATAIRSELADRYLKIYDVEYKAKGSKPASRREIYRRIERETGVDWESVERRLKQVPLPS